MAKDDELKKQQPWERIGITEELYHEIKTEVTKEVAPAIKEQILKDMQQETTTAEQRVNNKTVTYADRLFKANPQFKVKLGKSVGMWGCKDGSIKLSIFPDKDKKIHILSDIINPKHPNIEQIRAAINTEELVLVPPDTEQDPITFQQLSKGAGHASKRLGNIPDEVRNLLNNVESKMPALLAEIDSHIVLQTLLNLERQAQNDANRTRPNVVAALHSRIRALPLKDNAVGGMMDSTVTEEMPEDQKDSRSIKITVV